jgi:hypothetical protein
MQPVQLYTILFDFPLPLQLIKEFKSAVSGWRRRYLNMELATAQIPGDLFHNHDEETGKEINRYPLVQYHVFKGKAAITGINAGAMALLFLKTAMEERGGSLRIGGRSHPICFSETGSPPLIPYIHTIKILELPLLYRLECWLPFDTKRLQEWEGLFGMRKRTEFLEGILSEHLERMLQSMGFVKTVELTVQIENLNQLPEQEEYRKRKVAYDVLFSCNLALPAYVGIGQVPSIGFGRIVPFVNRKKSAKTNT